MRKLISDNKLQKSFGFHARVPQLSLTEEYYIWRSVPFEVKASAHSSLLGKNYYQGNNHRAETQLASNSSNQRLLAMTLLPRQTSGTCHTDKQWNQVQSSGEGS